MKTLSILRRFGAEWGAAAGVLALFVLALYAHLLLTNRAPANGDILYYVYPYRSLAADALRSGSIRLWNPYIFMGAPFLANPQSATLYPLHWPLIWLPVTQQVFWSAALHTWILGLGGYALLRTLRQNPGASLVAGLILAGSGFYGGLLGHLNQMNGAAWLPWAALVVVRLGQNESSLPAAAAADFSLGRRFRVGLPAAGVLSLLIALMLLAGHTQTVYINLFGLGAWLVAGRLWMIGWDWPATRRAWARAVGALSVQLLLLAIGCMVGVLISAAQLLPSLELSELGLRRGGLPYSEASSFSLRPLYLGWTLLPSYGLADLGVIFGTLGYSEYVAYVGLVGLALALGGAWRGYGRLRRGAGSGEKPERPEWTHAARARSWTWSHTWAFGVFFAGLGFFLAMGRWNPFYYLFYQLVPGFDLFRAPARWMMLYTLGVAVLAGLGADWLLARLRGFGQSWKLRARAPGAGLLLAGVLLAAIGVDLWWAARALPYTHPTAPQAVYDVRTAPAHLLTDSRRTAVGPGAMGRFLSISDIVFDPGDMADYRRIFMEREPPILDSAAFNELIVALKAQEILAPNLAMLRQIPGVDGFDGGTLPLQRYNEFLTLLIPGDELVPDGRLREQLHRIPPARLLNLLNAEYVITDKVRDLWFEGVYYDRQIGAQLGGRGSRETGTGETGLTVDVPYGFSTTHVDIVGYLAASEEVLTGLADARAPVAEIEVLTAQGAGETLILTGGGALGAHLADGVEGSSLARRAQATVAFTDAENGREEYRARLPLAMPQTPTQLVLRARRADLPVMIQAVTLYDARTDTFLALLPSDQGRFQLVHSGDVKIYQHLDALPRAYFVAQAVAEPDSARALAYLAQSDFDPAQVAVLDAATVPTGLARDAMQNSLTGRAEIVDYAPEAVTIEVATDLPALLVLSDVHYPGWRAYIDGAETTLYRANYLFRAVVVPPGAQQVVMRFEPVTYRWGQMLSALGLLCAGILLASARVRGLRRA